MKKHPFPVMWYEGMPLEPQVLQQNFLYNEEIREYIFTNIFPNSWGIVNLEWDKTYLAEGILRASKLEAIMPDYSRIIFPHLSDDILEIDLKAYKETLSQTSTVYLILPQEHGTKQNNAYKQRYEEKDVEEITDFNTKDSQSTIAFMKPKYSLFIGNIPPERHLAIPLAKIKFNGVDFEFQDYVPPVLKIDHNKMLKEKLENIIESGRDKLKYLMNKSIENNQKANTMTMNLAQIILPLESLVKEQKSPHQLFESLIKALPYALTLHKGTSLPSAPKYNHLNCAESIMPLLEFIELGFNNVKESYKQYKFAEDGDLFGINLENYRFDKHIIIGFVTNEKTTLEKTKEWAKSAIIGTEDRLTLIQDKRILGPQREIITYSPELDLNALENMVLLKIENNAQYISADKMLCILNLGNDENKPEQVFLFTHAQG